VSDHPKSSGMKSTLALLGHGQSSPTKQDAAPANAAGKHPLGCPCHECVAQRSVETFAACRDALKDPIPPYAENQRPPTLPRRPWHGDEQPTSFEGLARKAAIMSMAAQALPKGGRPKKWSTGELFRLLSEVAEIQTECPEMNNKEALKRYAENKGLSTSIKGLQNQLSTARKRFPKG
jgi:hypothetical protein